MKRKTQGGRTEIFRIQGTGQMNLAMKIQQNKEATEYLRHKHLSS